MVLGRFDSSLPTNFKYWKLMGKFEILIVPSSSEEGDFEECVTIEDAKKIYKKGKSTEGLSENWESVREFSFDTVQERDAFIKGYDAAVGYAGDGVYFIN